MKKILGRSLAVAALACMAFPASVHADVVSLLPRTKTPMEILVDEGFAFVLILVIMLSVVTIGLVRFLWGNRRDGDASVREPRGPEAGRDDALRLKDEDGQG